MSSEVSQILPGIIFALRVLSTVFLFWLGNKVFRSEKIPEVIVLILLGLIGALMGVNTGALLVMLHIIEVSP